MEAGRSEAPMRKFMSHYVREKDVALFIELAKEQSGEHRRRFHARALRPTSCRAESRISDRHDFVSPIPDCRHGGGFNHHLGRHVAVTACVISTPLKLLLFLMVDGWHLLISSL